MSEGVVELCDVFCVHRTNEGDAAALAGTNLELARGEVLGVLGPSGAGKSTLLRVVAGIQPPSAGVVRVLGRDIGRMSAGSRSRLRHELMGFLGQDTETALSPDLRVRDAITLPLVLRGVPRRERRTRVDELLEATVLAGRADVLPGELSGGERQRFALCAALAHRPALLLADEPTGELDEASADGTRALIIELARTNGTSVILVTHDPATAGVADRTLRIRDGRIVGDRRGAEEALVINGGWLRLPSDVLTQAGIGRRARVRSTPDGVIVTRADSDSGPTGSVGSATASARPPARPAPARARCCRRDLRLLLHPDQPGRVRAQPGRRRGALVPAPDHHREHLPRQQARRRPAPPPSGYPAINMAWMHGALLAASMAAWLHQLTAATRGEVILDGHGVRGGKAMIETLRRRLIAVPARLVRHAGQLILRLPPGHGLLAEVLARLRALPATP